MASAMATASIYTINDRVPAIGRPVRLGPYPATDACRDDAILGHEKADATAC